MLQTASIQHLTSCPCCGHGLASPSLDAIVIDRRLTRMETAILGAIWAGKGKAVPQSRILTVMYADDPDGGPSEAQMRNTFNVLMTRIRTKLLGTGVSIAYDRHRGGHRIVFEGALQ